MRYVICLFVISLSLIGCATTNLPPVTSDEFVFQEDEKRLWLRSEEEQEMINESDMVYRNKRLNAYLNKIAKKIQPSEAYRKVPFKIVVLKNPYSNAFAYPNGTVYVHTGILARIDNEAQMATLLAHEMTHATHRHQVREFRGIRNKSAVFASIDATFGDLPAIGGLATVLGAIGTQASVTGHSRALETEADMVGIKLVMRAGYDPREAPKLFQHIKNELDEEGVKEPFFFGTHPRLQDRIENYEDFLRNQQNIKGGVKNTKVYRRKISSAILENAFLDLQAGRFQSAERGAKKYLSIKSKSARGHYLLGEIYRQRGGEGDLKRAKKQYRKAISLNRSHPDAHKGIGLLYYKQGKKSKARNAFQSYLRLSPKASDRDYIKQYIAQCR